MKFNENLLEREIEAECNRDFEVIKKVEEELLEL